MAYPEELISDTLPSLEVSLLAGASGAGKTTLIMQALKALQDNEPVFGHSAVKDLKIGYIAADRSWRSYCRTASGVGLDLDRIKIRALIDDPTIDLKHFEEDPLSELERLIGTMLPLDLVVVDPLVVFLGCDTNKYHLNAARLIRLNKLCIANQITILGTHHATKARSDYSFKRPQDRISGSTALLGFTSTQLFLAAPQETGREDGLYEWHVISHHAPARVVLLSRDDQARFALQREEDLLHPLSLEDRILASVTGRPGVSIRKELVEEMSQFASASSVDRALGEMVELGQLYRPMAGVYQLATPQSSQ